MGEHMQEKPMEEFDRVEGHGPLPIALLIVFPSERYLAVLSIVATKGHCAALRHSLKHPPLCW